MTGNSTLEGLSASSYVAARLAIIESRARILVSRRRQTDPSPDDPFRGLHISPQHIDFVLASAESRGAITWDDTPAVDAIDAEADRSEAAGASVALRTLQRRAGLDKLDIDILLTALAPDVDVRFEPLYGYLNDDVSRRRATVNLALQLAGSSPWSQAGRARLAPDGALASSGLLVIEDQDRPFLSRSLRVPDRVANHLLGGEGPDPQLANLLSVPERAPANEFVGAFAGALRAGVPLVYLREKAASSAPSVAAAALDLAGRASIAVDLSRLGSHEEAAHAVRSAWTEALLVGASVIAGPIDRLAERHEAVWAALDEVLSRAGAGADGCQGRGGDPASVQFVLHGGCAWDPRWSRSVPLIVEVEAGTTAERLDMWRYQLGVEEPTGFGASDVTTQFLLTPDQIRRAVVTARLNALLRKEGVGFEDLRAGARAQNGAGLERLARRIHPRVGWDDLALAAPTEEALRGLAARARRRNQVLDEWGMRPGGGRGRGITVLFAGDSGTGKTMSAEVVAGDLGFDLYVVNLATVVDKYVGETEKNLERIFTEAAGVNAVLLFDEADAIFGKRSDVKDSNDRYANIEVAYLLQRMETFDGIAILATNLRANVDDAFTRRLDLIVDFPMPDVELRRALWDRCLTEGVPRADDLDLDFCARSFELSGGNIRSAAITAAYLAADGERPVTMLDLVLAVRQEYRKLGRLVVAGEFGRYFPFVQ